MTDMTDMTHFPYITLYAHLRINSSIGKVRHVRHGASCVTVETRLKRLGCVSAPPECLTIPHAARWGASPFRSIPLTPNTGRCLRLNSSAHVPRAREASSNIRSVAYHPRSTNQGVSALNPECDMPRVRYRRNAQEPSR